MLSWFSCSEVTEPCTRGINESWRMSGVEWRLNWARPTASSANYSSLANFGINLAGLGLMDFFVLWGLCAPHPGSVPAACTAGSRVFNACRLFAASISMEALQWSLKPTVNFCCCCAGKKYVKCNLRKVETVWKHSWCGDAEATISFLCVPLADLCFACSSRISVVSLCNVSSQVFL